MNRLQFETSPYLLQHKNNPVDWYPWNEESITKAVKEDKPILLSIGYSACHWCHVMEHECFENNKIAQFMNENYVNIKVDREERPDIDSIYMNFVQMTTGSGGWPLTVVLTPELIPFFGGTYFPPEDKFGRPGFYRVLKTLADTYKTRKDDILAQKKEIIEALKNMGNLPKNKSDFSSNDFNNAFMKISASYDKEWGGFGEAPKFPNSMTHMFLLRYFSKARNNDALEMTKNSLIKMACGGMYDQIGGGFHRYSTDEQWLVPHFEKMLYDNALLSRVYLETYQVTKDKFFLNVAEDIFSYVLREMTDQTGGFYSAQNADSEGKEGKFFVWKLNELNSFLNDEEISTAARFFSITESGNFESANILTAPLPEMKIGQPLNMNDEISINRISEIKEKMLSERNKRVKPSLDNKILVNWNGLMINAFALGYGITGNDVYLKAAVQCAEFIWEKCFDEKTLFHSFKEDEKKINGYLDDYSFIIEALISLYEVSFDVGWLNKAKILTDIMIAKFHDIENKDFYFTSQDSSGLIIRVKDLYDNALPSGNSSAVFSLLKLSKYLNLSDYYNIAYDNLLHMHEYVIKYPLSFSYILCAAYFDFIKPKEIAIIVKDNYEINHLRNKLYNNYLPFSLLAIKTSGKESELELLKDKELVNDTTTFYICQDFICNAPTNDFDAALNEIINNM